MPVMSQTVNEEIPQAIQPMHETSNPIAFEHWRHTRVEYTQWHK